MWDRIFDVQPSIEAVHFGRIPFSPPRPLAHYPGRGCLSSRRLYSGRRSSSSELLQRPDRDLRHEHAPFAKGMLAFDALTSIGYGAE